MKFSEWEFNRKTIVDKALLRGLPKLNELSSQAKRIYLGSPATYYVYASV